MRTGTYPHLLRGACVALAVMAIRAGAHCEIPCGIYDDAARLDRIAEHITTIEKSIKSIRGISAADEKDPNRLVRWVVNKEDHATRLQHIVTRYFMTQRIKPREGKDTKETREYVKRLTLLHEILVYAMKAKQSLDLSNVTALRSRLEEFRKSYLGKSSK